MEEYVEVTIQIKKDTLEGLRKFEDIYYPSVEWMLSIEADTLLDEFIQTSEM